MGALLIPVIVLLVLLVLGLVWMRRWGQEHQHHAETLADPGTPTLDYHVPEGQDPATVVAALQGAGYSTAVDPGDTQLVRVECAADERERVRSVIGSVDTTGIDSGAPLHTHTIRFQDER